jgi:hypothetical protein
MEPISHTGYTFGIIGGSWVYIPIVLFIIFFAVKLFKSASKVLRCFYLLFILAVLVLILNIV